MVWGVSLACYLRPCYIQSLIVSDAWVSKCAGEYVWMRDYARPHPTGRCPGCKKHIFEAQVAGEDSWVHLFKAKCIFCKEVLVADSASAAEHGAVCQAVVTEAVNLHDRFGGPGSSGAFDGPELGECHCPPVRRVSVKKAAAI